MSTTVVVPARDYIIPVFEDRDRTYTTTYTTGFLLINATDRLLLTNRMYNPGFEIAGTGGDNIWAGWGEAKGEGLLVDETVLVHGGSHAMKAVSGPDVFTFAAQGTSLDELKGYTISFWTRGDGTNAGMWSLEDTSNGDWLVELKSTGVTGTSWEQVSYSFVAPYEDGVATVSVQLLLQGPPTDGGIAYFDDVSFDDKLILQDTSGTSIQAPVVVIPFRDYTIPVPERLTNG